MDAFKPIVIGSGAWGTALATHLSRTQGQCALLYRSSTLSQEMNNLFSGSITALSTPKTLGEYNLIFWAVPCTYTPHYLEHLKAHISPGATIIICSKGFITNAEHEDPKLISDFFKSQLPNALGILSGPNFAHEIAQGLPAATTLACQDKKLSQAIGCFIRSTLLRVYLTEDIIGVQIAGALKNIIAIACGIAAGLERGENAKAALITRGLAEIRRLGIAKGGQLDTFLGLAGLGDLVLTCSSVHSRNYSFGLNLGKGLSVEEALQSSPGIVEGFYATKAAHTFGQLHDLHMPITHTLNRILYLNEPLIEAIRTLTEQSSEWENT